MVVGVVGSHDEESSKYESSWGFFFIGLNSILFKSNDNGYLGFFPTETKEGNLILILGKSPLIFYVCSKDEKYCWISLKNPRIIYLVYS